jgi:serine/threonine protein kinase/tetratricopeptide (TPR) repeat protein
MKEGASINGKYTLRTKISEGGGGIVWLATTPDEQEVALKTLKWSPLKSKELATERFKNEFAIFKELVHPNIAKIYDFGFDPAHGVYYFTSELLTAGDLKTFIGRPIEEIEPLLLQALRSLEYLRNHGLAHLDIKPQNFLLREGDSSPNLVLIDFGLATFRAADTPGGTPNYIPPEIVVRRSADEFKGFDFPPPDHRSDLYCLGVTFYYILTGVQPFRVENEENGRIEVQATLKCHLELENPPSPSQHRSDIPAYLDTIIMKLMSYHPDNRYPAAALAAQALRYRSPGDLEPEDMESLLSYLPKKGRMVGRKQEMETATEALKKFADETSHSKPILCISGGKGTGRTRMLESLKPFAQQLEMETHLINAQTASADQLVELSTTEPTSPRPRVLLIDDLDAIFVSKKKGNGTDAFYSALGELIQKARRTQRLSSPTTARIFIAFGVNTETVPLDKLWEKLGVEEGMRTTVELKNFTREEISEYLEHLLGEETSVEATEALHRVTQGNPLYVTEYFERMIGDGRLFSFAGRPDAFTLDELGIDFEHLPPPKSLEEVTLLRFQSLPSPAQDLIGLMACWERPVNLEELHQTFDGEAVEANMFKLASTDLIQRIQDDDGHFCFTNPMSARIIENQLDKKKRELFHSHIADYLERYYPNDRSRIDLHRARSSHKSRRLRALERLAKEAEERHHPHELTEHLEALLEEIPRNAWDMRADALIRLGRAYEWAYMPRHSQDAFKRLMKLKAPATKQKYFKVRSLEQLALSAIRRRELDEAREFLVKGLDVIGKDSADLGWRLRLQNFMAGIDLRDGKVDDAVSHFEETAKLAEELPPQEKQRLTNNELGESLLHAGKVQEAFRILNKELEEAQRADDPDRICSRYYLLGNVMCTPAMSRHEAAMNYYEHALKIAKDRKLFRIQVRIYNSIGNLKLDTSYLDDAIDFYKKGLALSEQIDSKTTSVELIVGLGLAFARKRDFDTSIEYFESALDFVSGPMGTSAGIIRRFEPTIYVHLGDAYYHKQDFERAMHYLEEAKRLDQQRELTDDIRYSIYGTFVEIFVEMGETDKARDYLPTLEDIVKRFPTAKDHFAQLEQRIH